MSIVDRFKRALNEFRRNPVQGNTDDRLNGLTASMRENLYELRDIREKIECTFRDIEKDYRKRYGRGWKSMYAQDLKSLLDKQQASQDL